MGSTIDQLDEKITDHATKVMLKNVVKRKEKFDQLKRKHFWTVIVSLLLGLLLIIYLYYFIVLPYSYSFFEMFFYFIRNPNALPYFVAVFGTYGYMIVLKRKMDKAEKEYHALRCEIVDRSKDLWKQEQAWKSRHTVFDMMKEKYDINLYHENK